MLVVRMENAEHEGPYTSTDCNWYGAVNHDDDAENHPSVSFDKGLSYALIGEFEIRYGGPVLFGFRDMEQALAWFAEDEITTLASMGFSLGYVEAEAVLQGDKQLVFVRAKC